jgi:hypothetical protein
MNPAPRYTPESLKLAKALFDHNLLGCLAEPAPAEPPKPKNPFQRTPNICGPCGRRISENKQFCLKCSTLSDPEQMAVWLGRKIITQAQLDRQIESTPAEQRQAVYDLIRPHLSFEASAPAYLAEPAPV